MHDKPYENLYAYLEATGILNEGTDSDIKAAKLEYWKEYRRLYKQAYRRRNRQITAQLSQRIFTDVKDRVTALGVSIPRYVKGLVETDLGKEVSIGTPDSVIQAQTLSRIYSEIQNLIRNHVDGSDVPPYLYDELLARIEYLEASLLKKS